MRPDLCRTLGTHDARTDGTCRDCGKALTLDDPAASTCRLEDLPGRGVSSPAPVGFWRRWSA